MRNTYGMRARARTHTHTDILTYPAVVEHFAVRAKSFLFTCNIWKCLRFEENIFIKCLMLWRSSRQWKTALVHISEAPQNLGRGANEILPCLKSQENESSKNLRYSILKCYLKAIKHYLKAMILQREIETYHLLKEIHILLIFNPILINGVLSQRLLEFILKSRDWRNLAFMC